VFHAVRAPTLRLFQNPMTISREAEVLRVVVNGPAVFTNTLAVRSSLSALPEGVTEVQVDLAHATLVDPTFLAALRSVSAEWEGARLVVVRPAAQAHADALHVA
jgi:hypothetical protein